MELLELIKSRRTVRMYTEEQVKQSQIEKIIEAGIWAPSGHNHQPWHFTVIQNKDLLDEINAATKEVAKRHRDEMIRSMANNEKLHIFYNAPTVIIVSYDETAVTPVEDISAATQNMLLMATDLNIGSCWNEMVTILFNSEKRDEFAKKLEIPEGYRPHHAILLGYPNFGSASIPKRKELKIKYIK